MKRARHGKDLKSYEQYYPAQENGLEVIFLIDWKGWDWLSCRGIDGDGHMCPALS